MSNFTNLTEFLKTETLEVTFKSKKAGKEVTVDVNSLPIQSVIAFMQYGAQRFINDKIGGSEIDEKEAGEIFDKIFKQLQDGWEGRTRGEGADPIETKARGIARDQIKAAIMAKGLKLKDVGKEKVAELTENLFKKNRDEYMEQAAKLLEAEKQARDKAADAVDLGDLGL